MGRRPEVRTSSAPPPLRYAQRGFAPLRRRSWARRRQPETGSKRLTYSGQNLVLTLGSTSDHPPETASQMVDEIRDQINDTNWPAVGMPYALMPSSSGASGFMVY